MAHNIKVETVAALNKDGSPSKTRKNYMIYDRTRRGKIFMGKCTSKKELNAHLLDLRSDFIAEHLRKHPNDKAFQRKHGVMA